MKLTKKRKIEIILILSIILIGGLTYLAFAYYPIIEFRLKNNNLTEQTIFTDNIETYAQEVLIQQETIPEENLLVIPRIGVKTRIWEGEDLSVLNTNEGVWHEPLTSNPERGSNMVIAGHRRQFLPPNTATFYLLPELKEGDVIIVFWNKKEYLYKVTKSFETYRTDQFTYEKTQNTTITLYTCSPLATAKQRWVIRAEIVN